jgi:SAM-dependent methyltransferase
LIGPMGHGRPSGQFEIQGGWDSIGSVVDVGGGTGAMLAEILRVRPGVTGILVDLPSTVARTAAKFEAAGVQDRASVMGQSFFEPLPANADIYLLRGVLNDWPDLEAEQILRRCAEAAGPRGRVVIMKGVIEDGRREDLAIEMLLCGGRHRSVNDLRELASRSGLRVHQAARQGDRFFVVECSKERY